MWPRARLPRRPPFRPTNPTTTTTAATLIIGRSARRLTERAQYEPKKRLQKRHMLFAKSRTGISFAIRARVFRTQKRTRAPVCDLIADAEYRAKCVSRMDHAIIMIAERAVCDSDRRSNGARSRGRIQSNPNEITGASRARVHADAQAIFIYLYIARCSLSSGRIICRSGCALDGRRLLSPFYCGSRCSLLFVFCCLLVSAGRTNGMFVCVCVQCLLDTLSVPRFCFAI